MSNFKPPQSSKQEKIDWLIERPELWEHWTEVTEHRVFILFNKMQDAGLYSKTTNRTDHKLERYIGAAREWLRQQRLAATTAVYKARHVAEARQRCTQ